MLTRRSLLATPALAVPGCSFLGALPGTLSGADMARGHLLRTPFAAGTPAETRRTKIAIIGGGIAGLSAAFTLAEAGHRDFRLFELEDSAGGNSRAGRNAVSAYPLGAHYLPIPNPESSGVRHFLERIGTITGWQGGKPVFDPYQIVADPEERILHLGRWQEGLIPAIVPDADRADLAAFFAAMDRFRDHKTSDGRRAFAIPMDLSSRDPDLRALDALSFTAWLDARGWSTPTLRAHLRYCTRDEYGTEPGEVSAWAGIHYFAARRGEAANCAGDAVLTWPAGNGYLAAAMARRVAGHIEPGIVVAAVRTSGDGAQIDALDVANRRRIRILADAAIIALPRFVAAHVVAGASAKGFGYSPWVVANVTADRLPAGQGAKLAWDNVSATSDSLGYVVATHQGLAAVPGPTVLTWYTALSDMTPATARTLMTDRPLADWQRIVHDDLMAMNPDLAGAIRRIDVWRWGHAMVRPVPGFFFGGARENAAKSAPPLFNAHSDLSGLSIFEEAHFRGSTAAEAAMTHLGFAHVSVHTA
ncbi:amino oxidase [Polymorphobacter glacialis]|uniref:Amino oxidase n=1 Tax=Sandarakinorhabdus glacialis TaxID=1614636 RepID=A0A916ZZY7_9SPHN|nr:NAD(P)-binding protein [Polymorphobacter glacialis]GGE20092.1 amino oxidase [Polymorphobacter glacialis]